MPVLRSSSRCSLVGLTSLADSQPGCCVCTFGLHMSHSPVIDEWALKWEMFTAILFGGLDHFN